MKKISIVLTAAILALALAATAHAFRVKRSGALGDQKSGAIGITAANTDDANVVLAADLPSHSLPGKVYVITDICYWLSGDNDSVVVKAGGSTLFVFTPTGFTNAGTSQCHHFESGFVVGNSQNVTCDARSNNDGYSCSVSGYVTNQ